MNSVEYYLTFEQKSNQYFVVSKNFIIWQDSNRCKFKHKRQNLDCLIISGGKYNNYLEYKSFYL